MTPKRPTALRWTGKTYGDGRPVEFISDLEPRDYDEAETAQLSQEQLASARRSGLYSEVHKAPPKAKKATTKKATREPAPEPETTDQPADAPGDAAEPAQEGEG